MTTNTRITLTASELFVLASLDYDKERGNRAKFRSTHPSTMVTLIDKGLVSYDDVSAPQITEKGSAFLEIMRQLPPPIAETTTVWKLPADHWQHAYGVFDGTSR